jgi:molecular chaperone DnaK
MLKDHGEGMEADEKTKIENALKDAKEAQKSENVEEIEAKSNALAEASHKLTEKMYAAQASAAGGGDGHAGSSSTAGGAGAGHAEGKDNVVDAEFEEVKDPGKA